VNILNVEGYSKLTQIVKENGKAVLSEKRVLISVSFVALIQTLKNDPEMVKSIQSMPSANDGKQHEDDNSNKHPGRYIETNCFEIIHLSCILAFNRLSTTIISQLIFS
jgi:hypothetical protein